MLLLRVAGWVKAKVSRESMDDFSVFSDSNIGLERSLTTQTIVGKLFVNFAVNPKPKRGPIKSTARTKTLALPTKRNDCVALNNSKCGSTSKTKSLSSPYDHTELEKFIADSCQLRLKNVLKSYFGTDPAEENFMISCGVKSLDEMKLDVLLNEFELQRLFNIDSDKVNTIDENSNMTQKINNNTIKATIKCYCSMKNLSHVIIYFRINSKWNTLSSGQACTDDPPTYLSTAWNSMNFNHHLKAHRKLRTKTEEIEVACEYFILF